MSALVKEACGHEIEQKYLRSILMTAAWFYNPHGDAPYSTWTPTTPTTEDFGDGAGGPVAEDALRWCNEKPTDIEVGGGDYEVDLTDGDNAPEWMNASQSMSLLSYHPNEPHNGSGTANFKYYELKSFDLKDGTRFRATINWDTCPQTTLIGPPNLLSADLDLWLCDPDPADPMCIAVSRSYNNNWEGFDVIVPHSATYSLRVGYDVSHAPFGCNGSTTEPIGWAYAYGGPTDFITNED